MSTIDRNKLMGWIKGLVDMGTVKVAKEIPADAKIVVTRVEDFNPESNAVWHIEANKSYPRTGIVCHECKYAVVMSDGTYAHYSKNPNPDQIICNKCVFGL